MLLRLIMVTALLCFKVLGHQRINVGRTLFKVGHQFRFHQLSMCSSYQAPRESKKDMRTKSVNKVVKLIEEIIDPERKLFDPSSGLVLAGNSAHKSIDALRNPQTLDIFNAPVDARLGNRDALLASLQDAAVTEGRRHLLCIPAYSGTGKSVQLAFNSAWFVEETKGIAVDTTFHDDQKCLDTYGVSFEQAIAMRILHRLLFNHDDQRQDDEYVFSTRHVLGQTILQLTHPIEDALQIVRTVLRVPAQTKILLCVDGLLKVADLNDFQCSVADMLRILTSILDRNPSQLYLAASVIGAVDVHQFAVQNQRPIIVQTLPPLFFDTGFDLSNIKSKIPSMLQPFFNKELRQYLPSAPFQHDGEEVHPTLLYDHLYRLLLRTRGDPRQVETLFKYLKICPAQWAAPQTAADKDVGMRQQAEEFVHKVHSWLHSKVIIFDNVTLSTSYLSQCYADPWAPSPDSSYLKCLLNVLVAETDANLAVAINALAVDTARRYDPFSADSVEHMATIRGMRYEHTAFVSPPDRTLRSLHNNNSDTTPYRRDNILTFLPINVLQSIRTLEWCNPEVMKRLDSVGTALVALASAVDTFQTWSDVTGERIDSIQLRKRRGDKTQYLQEVLRTALVLYTRANAVFSPSTFCDIEHVNGTSFSAFTLRGGADVQFWDKKQASKINSSDSHNSELQQYIQRLRQSGAPGAIWSPTRSDNNQPYHTFGLFQVENKPNEFVLLVVQCVDWFADHAAEQSAVTTWSAYNDQAFPQEQIVLEEGQDRVTVTPLFMLFTANPVENQEQVERLREQCAKGRSAAGSFREMRGWLPSAAFPCEMVVRLRDAFDGPVAASK